MCFKFVSLLELRSLILCQSIEHIRTIDNILNCLRVEFDPDELHKMFHPRKWFGFSTQTIHFALHH